MYEQFYGFREKPFDLHPDPDFLYMSPGHDEAYTHLAYAIQENKGFVVVTGEIGSGKTTLINFLLQRIPQDVEVGLVNNTAVSPSQFLKMVCQEFELSANGMDKPEMLEAFNTYLLDRYASRRRVVLVVDEAQNLPVKTIEEVRLLSNLEAEKHHLLQIVLLGQPELRSKLRQGGLEQLVQRVAVHCHLSELNEEEVRRYVQHRLRVAGAGSLDIFDDSALQAVHRYSRGTPRLINILCDTALVYGFGEGKNTIDREVIEEVVKARVAGGLFAAPVQEAPRPTEPEEPPSASEKVSGSSQANPDLLALADRLQEIEDGLWQATQLLQGSLADRPQACGVGIDDKAGRRREAVGRTIALLAEAAVEIPGLAKRVRELEAALDRSSRLLEEVGRKNRQMADAFRALHRWVHRRLSGAPIAAPTAKDDPDRRDADRPGPPGTLTLWGRKKR